MRQYSNDYLSKSSVNAPLGNLRSPGKSKTGDYKADPYSHMDRSLAYPSRKEERPTFHTSRRGSEEMRELRQTFDSRTNSKLQEVLQKTKAYGEDQGPRLGK